MTTISFKYKNHHGSVSLRTVDVDSLEYFLKPNPEYGYQPGWFISGFCHDKKARRSFALTHIIFDEPDSSNKIISFRL